MTGPEPIIEALLLLIAMRLGKNGPLLVYMCDRFCVEKLVAPSPKVQCQAMMVLPPLSTPGALNCTVVGGMPFVGLAGNKIEGVKLGLSANTEPPPPTEPGETRPRKPLAPYRRLPTMT